MKTLIVAVSLAISATPVAAFTCSDLGIFAAVLTSKRIHGEDRNKIVSAVSTIYGDDSDLTTVAKLVWIYPVKKTPQETYNFWVNECMEGTISKNTKQLKQTI